MGGEARRGEAAAPSVIIAVPTTSILAFFAALGFVTVQLTGGAPGDAAAVGGLVLAGIIGWKADARYLASLLILCYPALGLPDADAQHLDWAVLPFPGAVRMATIGGLELGAPLIAIVMAAARTITDALRPRAAARGWVTRWPAAIFFVAAMFAVVGAAQGSALGLNRWTEGLRSVLALGGLFWGFMLVRTAGHGAERIPRRVMQSTVLGSFLWVVGLLQGHLIFMLTGLAAALLPELLRRRQWLGLVCGAAVATAGLVAGTLTTAAIVLVTLGTLGLAALPYKALRRGLLRVAVVAAVAVCTVMLWAVLNFSGDLAFQFTAAAIEGEGLTAYVMFKLMADRGPLWLAAMQQIAGGPHWIAPSGRPLLPIGGWMAGMEWESGAHNSILQVLRNVGLAGGVLVLGLITMSVVRASKVLASSERAPVRALAAAFIGVALSGIATGDFPVADVGFFLWCLGGIAIGLHTYLPVHHPVSPAQGDRASVSAMEAQ
jgi:hypothetical protein